MTGRYPEIPSTTRKEQDELREKTNGRDKKERDVSTSWIGGGAPEEDMKSSPRENWEKL